jgi:hypothetical protein
MSIESFITDHATLTPEQMAAKYPCTYAAPATVEGRRLRGEESVAAQQAEPPKDIGDQVADLMLARKYGCDSLEEAAARGIVIPELQAPQ